MGLAEAQMWLGVVTCPALAEFVMSQRTIIEINHDHLDTLKDAGAMFRLAQKLACGEWKDIENGAFPGIRWLGQRHHSEMLSLKVK